MRLLPGDGYMAEFGISLKANEKMMTVEGRLLAEPKMAYRDQSQKPSALVPRNGAWMLNKTTKLLNTTHVAAVPVWCCIDWVRIISLLLFFLFFAFIYLWRGG